MNIDWHLNRTKPHLLAILSHRRISRQFLTLPNFEVRVARRAIRQSFKTVINKIDLTLYCVDR